MTAASNAWGRFRHADARRPRWLLFIALAVAIPIVDQIVKAWVVANFELGRPVDVIGDTVRLVLIHNNGGLFGLFSGQAQVFAAVSLVVIALIVWYESQVGRGLLATLALGLLLGGAIGNLIDRLRLGFVLDFVDMGVGAWRWYVYNVADASISTAIVLLLVLAIWPERRDQTAAGGDADDDEDEVDEAASDDARTEPASALRAADNRAGD